MVDQPNRSRNGAETGTGSSTATPPGTQEGHKLNCWEFKRCGREPGGDRVGELGECPAPLDASADRMNSGRNAGRICWAVSGHFSDDGEIRCATAKELVSCMACEFFKSVLQEEGLYRITFVKPQQAPEGQAPECLRESRES